jgi:hypothetical protein
MALQENVHDFPMICMLFVVTGGLLLFVLLVLWIFHSTKVVLSRGKPAGNETKGPDQLPPYVNTDTNHKYPPPYSPTSVV